MPENGLECMREHFVVYVTCLEVVCVCVCVVVEFRRGNWEFSI